jgi:hypothetical protein
VQGWVRSQVVPTRDQRRDRRNDQADTRPVRGRGRETATSMLTRPNKLPQVGLGGAARFGLLSCPHLRPTFGCGAPGPNPLILSESLLLGEWRALLMRMAGAVTSRRLGLALTAPIGPVHVAPVVGCAATRAECLASFLGVVSPMIGRRNHGQVVRLDAADRPAFGVVHILERLDGSAKMHSHHDPGDTHPDAGDLRTRA